MPRKEKDSWRWSRDPEIGVSLADFEAGFVVGVLVGEGQFGGDGRQAQVTLRLQDREESLFPWLLSRLPAGMLYGPYEYVYKDGGTRRFYQLMYRGVALRTQLLPFLDQYDWREMAPHAFERCQAMRQRYRLDVDPDLSL